MRGLALAAVALAGSAQAGEVVTSPAASAVSVTVYRAPQRDPDQAMELGWLGGYALVTETREVAIPAGEAVIRFEGVAAGMLPESAIVSGLPKGVSEKNLDADLLSPRNLYARSFGRPVVLRRTDAKGHVREERAVIRSAPDGAAIVQTKAGFEVANCGGLKDALVYQGVPEGLSARPTLSVATNSPAAVRVKVQLSYLAWGFDWQANYVVRMKPGAQAAEMTAWVTLASSDATTFREAQAAVVGGKLNFDEERDEPEQAEQLVLQCQLSRQVPPPMVAPPPPMNVAMAAPMMAMERADMVVARKSMAPVVVSQEALGDLKLYRVPMATTVAAHAQKQVALMDARDVKLAVIYVADIYGQQEQDALIKLRMQNRKADGLGLALPAGKVAVVQPYQGAAIPFGEGHMDDKAEGEEVNVELSTSPQVHVVTTSRNLAKGLREVSASVGNANRWPVHFEGRLRIEEGARIERASAKLGRKDGMPLWSVTIPAQGSAKLVYRLRAPQ